jgi:hypothetical protein
MLPNKIIIIKEKQSSLTIIEKKQRVAVSTVGRPGPKGEKGDATVLTDIDGGLIF